jgi:predicted component of type VI protein secretion system
MPQLVISLPHAGEVIHELTPSKITIGRVEENLIQIDDPSVSTRHAELLQSGTGYLVKDLGSTNGSAINGEPLTEAKRLKDGDRVSFGKIEAIYHSISHSGSLDLPEEKAAAAAIPAASSHRPQDFGNASPFASKRKKKNPLGMAAFGVAALAFLAFLASIYFVYLLEAPHL